MDDNAENLCAATDQVEEVDTAASDACERLPERAEECQCESISIPDEISEERISNPQGKSDTLHRSERLSCDQGNLKPATFKKKETEVDMEPEKGETIVSPADTGGAEPEHDGEEKPETDTTDIRQPVATGFGFHFAKNVAAMAVARSSDLQLNLDVETFGSSSESELNDEDSDT